MPVPPQPPAARAARRRPTARKQKERRDVERGGGYDDDASVFGTSGDPFGDTIRGEVLSFRLLMQARYADDWPVSQPRDNSIEGERDIVNATENDGWRMNRLFLRRDRQAAKVDSGTAAARLRRAALGAAGAGRSSSPTWS